MYQITKLIQMVDIGHRKDNQMIIKYRIMLDRLVNHIKESRVKYI